MYINSYNEEILYNSIETNEVLSISMAGTTFPNPNYQIMHNVSRDFFYDFYVFEYVLSGKGHIEYENGKTTTVQAGDFYFLNKLKKHYYYADKKDPYKKIFFVAKGTFIDSLINTFNITESLIIQKLDVEKQIREIHSLVLKPQIDYQRISFIILDLLYSLGKDYFKLNNRTMELAELIRKYLDTQINQKLSLDKISSDLNISKSHIERIFKKAYKTTPLNYFMKQKTEYACALLVNTSYSITEIAEQTGFFDSKYMSKCVKKETGLSPLQYRKAHR